jgi:hypothetical protein
VVATPQAHLGLGPLSPGHPPWPGGHFLAPTFTIGNLILETDEEYLAVVRAADAELSETDQLPPDPLPEL